jgi:hypothetical protein
MLPQERRAISFKTDASRWGIGADSRIEGVRNKSKEIVMEVEKL